MIRPDPIYIRSAESVMSETDSALLLGFERTVLKFPIIIN